MIFVHCHSEITVKRSAKESHSCSVSELLKFKLICELCQSNVKLGTPLQMRIKLLPKNAPEFYRLFLEKISKKGKKSTHAFLFRIFCFLGVEMWSQDFHLNVSFSRKPLPSFSQLRKACVVFNSQGNQRAPAAVFSIIVNGEFSCRPLIKVSFYFCSLLQRLKHFTNLKAANEMIFCRKLLDWNFCELNFLIISPTC